MDNLTHTLVGLMMSRCGLDSLGANRNAKGTAVMLMLAANAPDIDTYPFFRDSLEYLEVHRGYTHALVFVPLVALVPLAIVKGVTRTRPSFVAWFSCILVVLSHLLLDWTNVYGIRMLLPFSDRWLRLDMTNVIDPVIWLILAVALAVPSLLGLVSSTIGARKTSGVKRAWAWIALAGLFSYEWARWNSHEKARSALNSLLYMDEPAVNVYAFPDSFGTLRWRGVVEGDGFFYEMPVDFSGNFTMRGAKIDYKVKALPSVDAAKQTRTFQVFESFNQVPFWRASPLVDVTQVDLLDLRFGSITRKSGFSTRALVEPDGRIREVNFLFGR